MINEKLAQHISNELWVQKSKVVEVLASYEETPLEVKHPIKLVNEKYPNGWYCEAFEEVREDSEKANQDISQSEWKYYGWFYCKDYGFVFIGFNDFDLDLSTVTLITKSEYLAITRGVEEQTTIHTSKPCDIEERVKALEAAILPTKRNLDIDTPTIDWKKVECLSWDDIMEVASICAGEYFASANNGDRRTLETFIKNKLKK